MSDVQTTEIDTAVPTDINEATPTTIVADEVPTSWIEVIDGQFTCSECENTSVPETNTVEGVIPAHLDEIQADLKQYPTKVIYGICPVCGMEYVFRLKNDKLYLEPSDMEK